MRRARITYQGAYHHVMNRGLKGERIFQEDSAKQYFLTNLYKKSENLRIKLLSYCIMNNHYHLILQNTSEKLSEFMKQLNSQYGTFYRKRNGGKGYVFQSRYKSPLIQDDKYLKMAIIYTLLNPVRASIVKDPFQYKWSSINDYYSKKKNSIIDVEFIQDLFNSKDSFCKLLSEWGDLTLEINKTRFGSIIGDENFIKKAIQKYNRRMAETESERRRKIDYIFKSTEEVISRFEKEKKVNIENINVDTYNGKRLRSLLLIHLKDQAGLKYSEIIKYPIFRSLKHSSLSQLYKKAKYKYKN